MLTPTTRLARGHLRLASGPARSSGSRLAKHARAWMAALSALIGTVVAWCLALPALMPVLIRRAPIGRRLHQRRLREARIIPFQPRRRAVPR